VAQPIKKTTKEERKKILKDAKYQIFNIPSRYIYVDLLSDSGTGTMSTEQWAGMMRGDEAYASRENFFHFEKAVKDVFGFEYALPAHVGRASEHILFRLLAKPGTYIPSNLHFDTGRTHAELLGAYPVDFLTEEALDTQSDYPFKGNTDLKKLEEFIEEKGPEKISFFYLVAVNNQGGGQPVSMENIRKTKELLSAYKIPFVCDLTLAVENAYLIKQREPGYKDMPLKEVLREMMSYFDAAAGSVRKHAMTNIGAVFCCRDRDLYQKAAPLVVAYEGHTTYGGIPGRDLEAIAIGLYEYLNEELIGHHMAQIRYMVEMLDKAGVPSVKPPGGVGCYVDARLFYPHIPREQFPGYALTCALYVESGVRACEMGTLHAGERAKFDFMRMAIPRRLYTYRHLDLAIVGLKELYKRRDEMVGFRFTYEPPIKELRIFLGELEPLPGSPLL